MLINPTNLQFVSMDVFLLPCFLSTTGNWKQHPQAFTSSLCGRLLCAVERKVAGKKEEEDKRGNGREEVEGMRGGREGRSDEANLYLQKLGFINSV